MVDEVVLEVYAQCMVEALFAKYLCEQGLVNGWKELGNVQKDSH